MTNIDPSIIDDETAFSFPPTPIVTALGDWKGLLVMGLIFALILWS